MTLSGLLPAATKLFQTKTQLGLDPGRGHCPVPEQMAAGPGRCPLPSGSSALCRHPWATPLKGPALRAGWRRLGGAEGKWRRPRPGAGPGGGGLTCPPDRRAMSSAGGSVPVSCSAAAGGTLRSRAGFWHSVATPQLFLLQEVGRRKAHSPPGVGPLPCPLSLGRRNPNLHQPESSRPSFVIFHQGPAYLGLLVAP